MSVTSAATCAGSKHSLPHRQVPSLSRPGLVDMGRAGPAEAGPPSAPPARKQDAARGARRSASMGSQALQSSMGQKLSLLNGTVEGKHIAAKVGLPGASVPDGKFCRTVSSDRPFCDEVNH